LPDGPLSVNSIGLMCTLATHGLGIAGLSVRYAAALVGKGLLERVLPGWRLPTMTVWCVMPGRRLLPRRTSAFVAMLEASLAGAPTAPA